LSSLIRPSPLLHGGTRRGDSALSARAAATFSLQIFFDGGNAYVASQSTGEVVVGAVAARAPSEHYNKHGMRLLVETGYDEAQTDLLPAKIGEHVAWDLHGWSVEICPDGACLAPASVELSPAKASQDDCADGPDNLSIIPDFSLLHASVSPKAKWRDELDSELALRGGKLTIDKAVSCFTLKGSNKTFVRGVAGGHKEINWARSMTATFVDVMLTPKFGNGGKRRIRLTPSSSQGIQARISTTGINYPKPAMGKELMDFRQFYAMYESNAIPEGEQFKLFPLIIPGATPGTECPPALFRVP
jgi:hypothetical protein